MDFTQLPLPIDSLNKEDLVCSKCGAHHPANEMIYGGVGDIWGNAEIWYCFTCTFTADYQPDPNVIIEKDGKEDG